MTGPGGALGLERDRERRWIAGVIGTLSLLATLALGLALSLSAAGAQWRADFEGILTVEIPAEDDAAAQAAKVAAALAVLRADPAIERAEALGRARAQALLAPWLGQTPLDALPLPALIDARARKGAKVDLPALQARLDAAVAGARADDHARWLAGFLALARAAGIVAFVVTAAVAIAAAGAVGFATRAGLAMHREAVDLLHLVGAADSYIAGQFARAALRLALAGSALGALAGAVVLAVAHAVATASGALAFPLPALDLAGWAAIGLVPAGATAVAAASAYATVLRALARIV
ncbi:MAG: cell division protein [Azospirillum sp.]|nr:cell division protein [Azospirillum sp.]MCA3265401.1 cell division protein [Azospirillum sp.]